MVTQPQISSVGNIYRRRNVWIVLDVIYVFYGLATLTLWKSFKNGLASVQRGKNIFHILYCGKERSCTVLWLERLLYYCLEGFLKRTKKNPVWAFD
jgi:hypothetical protein